MLKTNLFWFSTFLSVMALFLGTSVFVSAMLAPEVYITELEFSKSSFNPGDTVFGEVSLWNYEERTIGDLVLNFQLLGEEVQGVPTETIDSYMDETVFNLSAGQKAKRSFSYQLPSNLPRGDFVLRVQLSNSRGEELSWSDKVVSIGGDGKFLKVENHWLIVGGSKTSPGGGVEYQPGEAPRAAFDVANKSNFTISALLKITTYKRSEGQFLREDRGSSLVLEPGERRSLEATFPSLEKAEAYLTKVQFYESQSQEQISNPVYFRWVVSGDNDAEILFANPDKESYEKGEKVNLQIDLTGPAHTYSEETPLFTPDQGKIEAILTDKAGTVICKTGKEIDLESSRVNLFCIAQQKVTDPDIKIKVTKEELPIDEYNFTLDVEKANKKKLGSEADKPSFFWQHKEILIVISFLSIVLIVTAMVYFRNRKLKGMLLVLLSFLVGFGLLLTENKVLAATEVTGGNCDTTIVFNKPTPNGSYASGDTVNFSGKFRVTSCGDGLFFNKVSFFIAEDKEIPLVSDSACGDCQGADSSSYPQSACSCKWCSQVKVLQLNDPNFKIRKLGEVFPGDVASGARPYWVEYNQNFTIPGDLDFSGPVRFYVQYSGTHWKNHWHWNITYQPGELLVNNAPSASGLSVAEGDYCSSPSHSFSWKYFDIDTDDESAFRIQLDDDADFSSRKIDRKVDGNWSNDSINTQAFSVTQVPSSDELAYNTQYYWRVKVWDDQGKSSPWSNGSPFSTKAHSFPLVDFSWQPEEPSAEENVQFIDDSVVYGAGTSKASWSWTFENGSPDQSNMETPPVVKFDSKGDKNVTLEVTDSDNYRCQKSQNLNIKAKLPKWREAGIY